jgi:hypothetical protein
MDSLFWAGFEKQAACSRQPTVISEWISEAEAAAKNAKNKEDKDRRVDPRELSEWRTPGTW